MLYLQGNVEEAIVLVKQWLEHDTGNPLALHRRVVRNQGLG
jgi:hypothetical protein